MEKGKTGKRITLIAGILLLLAAAAVIALGFMKKHGGSDTGFDFMHLSGDMVGQTVSGVARCSAAPTEDTDYGTLFAMYMEDENDESDSGYLFIGFDVPKSLRADFDFPGSEEMPRIPYTGTLKFCDPERTRMLQKYVADYCDMLAEAYKGTEYEDQLPKDMKETALASISPYYVEVTAGTAARTYFIIGITLAVLGVLLILGAFISPKAALVTLCILLGIVLIAAAVFAAVNFNKLRTMASVEKVSDGLYYMNCTYNYDCDKYLNANLSTVDDMICYVEDELYYGARVDFKKGNFACAAFTAACDNGDRLFGRNFDYPETDTLVFYTAPKNGYASYAVTDLRFFDIGQDRAFAADSLTAKAIMLAAPYASMDGINEKGVGVSILELETDELHQDNGKPDLLVFSAIRGILDKCASIDEALELLSQYDLHTMLDNSYHLFITDKSGRSVIVEWSGNETLLTEDDAVTNDIMSPEHAAYNPDWKCRRYDAIKGELEAHQSVFAEGDAMLVLKAASDDPQKSRGTQWSCIYDLDAFTLDICLDCDYDHVSHFADGKPAGSPRGH